jgi:hypothetical protein
MNKPEALASLARQSIAFVRDFAAFAGREGLWAATLAVVAAAFDGIGLLLLVPILSVVTASEAGTGWAHTVLVPLLDFVGAQTVPRVCWSCSACLPLSSSSERS